MTILEWRKNPGLRSMAAEMLNQPALQRMLQVVTEANPAFSPRPISSDFDATFELGRIFGFHSALTLLKQLSEPVPTQTPVEATWQPPEKT